MAVPNPSTADHAAHDALLLAALASGDALAHVDRARADAQVRDCAECALLLADLTAIRAATADLPAPRRRRDFRLTDADAARLRPSGWRGILGWFGSPRARLSGPAALGLATIGIAGLLVATVPATPMAERSSTFGTAISGASQQVVTGWVPAGGAGAQSLAPAGAGNAGDTAAGPTAAPAEPFGAGTERVASPEPSAGKAAPAAPSPGTDSAPTSEPAMVPAPAAAGTPGPAEAAGGVGVAGGQAAPSIAEVAGEAAPAAADATGGAGVPGTGWLLAASTLVLAAGLVLGALRLAGKRAVGSQAPPGGRA